MLSDGNLLGSIGSGTPWSLFLLSIVPPTCCVLGPHGRLFLLACQHIDLGRVGDFKRSSNLLGKLSPFCHLSWSGITRIEWKIDELRQFLAIVSDTLAKEVGVHDKIWVEG